MPRKRDTEKVADIVRDAGGKIVGRTRLQKIGYLLELSGLGEGFSFDYRHYGPFSEERVGGAGCQCARADLRRRASGGVGWLLFDLFSAACVTS